MAIFLPGSAAIASETARDQLGPGFLTAWSAFCDDATVQPGQLLVTASLCPSGEPDAFPIIHMVSAYLTKNSPVTWQGLLEIKDSYTIMITVLGDLAIGVYTNHNLITTTARGPIMEYLRHAVNIPQ